MSSINTSYSGQYYQLPSQAGATAASSATTTAATAVSASATTPDSAYMLNLSQSAQDYLSSLNSTSATASSQSSGYTLNSRQQQQVTDILTKYKDAPQTQDTYNAIQNDLKAAGLSTDQLALEKKINSFSPTQTLIDALNGTDTSPNSGYSAESTDPAAQKNDADSFMKKILSQWQAMSTQNAIATPTTAASPSLSA